MPIDELLCLLELAKAGEPQTIFEIGTFLGETTLQLAHNTRAKIWTLDLGPNEERVLVDPALDVYPDRVGARFLNDSAGGQVTQLLGDSKTFDFSSWFGAIDLVLVDANHHYEYVLQDSRTALKLVRPGGSVIWHDYANHAPGVVKALEALSVEVNLIHIKGTSLVVYQEPGSD